MSHFYYRSGSNGVWVAHTSSPTLSGSDDNGIGHGEDHIGPFGSKKLAQKVADALNHAYEAGKTEYEKK